jgi:hypothetical protein
MHTYNVDLKFIHITVQTRGLIGTTEKKKKKKKKKKTSSRKGKYFF